MCVCCVRPCWRGVFVCPSLLPPAGGVCVCVVSIPAAPCWRGVCVCVRSCCPLLKGLVGVCMCVSPSLLCVCVSIPVPAGGVCVCVYIYTYISQGCLVLSTLSSQLSPAEGSQEIPAWKPSLSNGHSAGWPRVLCVLPLPLREPHLQAPNPRAPVQGAILEEVAEGWV